MLAKCHTQPTDIFNWSYFDGFSVEKNNDEISKIPFIPWVIFRFTVFTYPNLSQRSLWLLSSEYIFHSVAVCSLWEWPEFFLISCLPFTNLFPIHKCIDGWFQRELKSLQCNCDAFSFCLDSFWLIFKLAWEMLLSCWCQNSFQWLISRSQPLISHSLNL